MSKDLSKLLQSSEYFARTNSDGVVEIVNERTGQIIVAQDTMEDVLTSRLESLVEVTLDDGTKCFMDPHMDRGRLPGHAGVQYSNTMADVICQRIAEGDSITKVCKDPKMPGYATLSRWRKAHKDFGELFEQALQDRAHMYHDKVIEAAEATDTKDDAAVQKVKVDAYKWAAEKGNPDRFGSRTKISGDKGGPLAFTIVTGVPQPEEKDVTPQEPQLDVKSSEPKEAPPEKAEAKTPGKIDE